MPNRDLPDLITKKGCYTHKQLNLRRRVYGNHVMLLQPRAMRAFGNVWDVLRKRDIRIWVASTYRSCADQRRVCESICGNANGCPGLCAPPGSSYHQLGLAIDSGVIKGASEKTLRHIYQDHGFNFFSPLGGSDPQHCSFHVTG